MSCMLSCNTLTFTFIRYKGMTPHGINHSLIRELLPPRRGPAGVAQQYRVFPPLPKWLAFRIGKTGCSAQPGPIKYHPCSTQPFGNAQNRAVTCRAKLTENQVDKKKWKKFHRFDKRFKFQNHYIIVAGGWGRLMLPKWMIFGIFAENVPKKPCFKIQNLQRLLDWKWPYQSSPPPFGTIPKIHKCVTSPFPNEVLPGAKLVAKKVYQFPWSR